MKRLFPIVLFLLAGCAGQSVQPDGGQPHARSSAAVHTELGAGYYSRHQYAVALSELRDAIKADSTYAPAYNVLGLVYMDLKENRKAKDNFERALDLSPQDSDINNNYGWFLCQNGQPKESIGKFLTALANPLYATPEIAYLNAGICSEKAGEDAKAAGYYRLALQIRPGFPRANLGLAGIDYRQGRYEAARNHLLQYMKSAEPTAQGLLLGVRIARKLGDSDAQADYATQLRNRFPDSQEAGEIQNGNE